MVSKATWGNGVFVEQFNFQMERGEINRRDLEDTMCWGRKSQSTFGGKGARDLGLSPGYCHTG